MKITELTWRRPVVVQCGETIANAARQMADEGVGALVVLDHERAVGMVTDRDIVTRGVATGTPLDARIDSLMTMGLHSLEPDRDVDDLFRLFERHAVRRVPIIDGDRIVGLVSLDDAIVSTTSNMAHIAKVLTAQILFPHAGDEPPTPVAV